MKKWLWLVLFVLVAVPVLAQVPVAVAGDRIAWDYKDADLSNYAVNRFEIQIDSGAWTSVGIPTQTTATADGKTYLVPFPALQPGNHTVSVRACNADLCSAGLGPLGFKLAVVPVDGSNLRIVKGGQ